MNILLITDNHNINGGGAEKSFFLLKQALQQGQDFQVHSLGFGTRAQAGNDYTILKETPSLPLRLWWRMFFNPLKYFQIKKVIQTLNPDVIHLHNIRKYTISLLRAVKGRRVVHTTHDFTSICPTGWNIHENFQLCQTGLTPSCIFRHKRKRNLILYIALLFAFFRMRKLLKSTVNLFISPSQVLQHYLQQQNFTPAITIAPFLPEQKKMQFERMQSNHFLYIGQLGKHKGVDRLIDEFALACQQHKNLMLHIAGIGEEEKNLKQQVAAWQLANNVIFHGWTDPEKLFAESAALIFPSIGLESFGLVITEAMANARAVIGSNRGPTLTLVENEKTGLLFDPLKKGDLAQKIILIANNKSLAVTLGSQAYDKLRQFDSNESVLTKIIEAYNPKI